MCMYREKRSKIFKSVNCHDSSNIHVYTRTSARLQILRGARKWCKYGSVIMIRFLFLSDTMSDHHEIDLTFVEINLTSLIK